MVAQFFMKNNVEDYRQLLGFVTREGEQVSPRGLDCVEVRNVAIEIEDPTDILAVGCGRRFNTKLAAYEALTLIAGISLPKKAIAIAPNLEQFANDDGGFDGAYGPRTAKQLEQAIAKLQIDPDTRQACVTLWRSWDLDLPTKDLPCTVYLNFSVRNRQLLMTTHMRSQDLWWGWPYDVVQFTQLQHTIANVLRLECGRYTHFINSLHVYSRNDKDIYDFTHKTEPDRVVRPVMQGLQAGNWYQAKAWATALLTDEETVLNEITNMSNESEEFFAAQKLWES